MTHIASCQSDFSSSYLCDEILANMITFADSLEYISLRCVDRRIYKITEHVIPRHIAIHGILRHHIPVERWKTLHKVVKYDLNVLLAAALTFPSEKEILERITREENEKSHPSPMQALSLARTLHSNTFVSTSFNSEGISELCLHYPVLLYKLGAWAKKAEWKDLKHIPGAIKTHRIFCTSFLFSKQENGTTIATLHPLLKHFPPSMKEDEKYLLAMAPTFRTALTGIPNELRNNRELFLRLVRKNEKCLQYASESVRNDIGVIKEAIKRDWTLFFNLALSLQENEQVALTAIENCDDIQKLIPALPYSIRERNASIKQTLALKIQADESTQANATALHTPEAPYNKSFSPAYYTKAEIWRTPISAREETALIEQFQSMILDAGIREGGESIVFTPPSSA